jgi:hypothetical protein
MEDILEELVGDIWDEHDEVVEDYKEVAEDTFRVDCGGTLAEFCDFFDLEIESDNITINGWIMEELDKIPACGDRFSYENLDITVIETDFRRVSTIEVVRREPDEDDEEDTKKSKRDRDRDEDEDTKKSKRDRDRDEDEDTKKSKRDRDRDEDEDKDREKDSKKSKRDREDSDEDDEEDTASSKKKSRDRAGV